MQPYSPSFRNRKRGKRFSRLNRRRESVATWRISRTKTIYASEISKTLISHCPQNCVAKSPRDRRADMGFCTKSNPIRHKCYSLYNLTVNRTKFSAQLAYGKMTLLNFSLLFPLVQSESTAYISFFANLFHFPKLSSVHKFHSLLRHLLISESAARLLVADGTSWRQGVSHSLFLI